MAGSFPTGPATTPPENTDPFGLGALTSAFDTQNQLTAKRQEEERLQQIRVNSAQVDMAKISVASAKVSQGVTDSLTGLKTVLDQNEQGAAQQDAMIKSGNPLDALQLIGKQMIDPMTYTREGRSKRLAEASAAANARISIGSAQQAMLQDAAKAVELQTNAQAGQLNLAKLAEQQGNERIQNELTRVQSQAGQLASSTQIQNLTLAGLSADQTRAALAKSGGQPINIGGVVVTPGALQDRVELLDQRQDIQDAREAALATKKMDLDQRLAKRELETMNLEELRPMLMSGDPSGRFKLSDIQATYNIKSAAQTDMIQNATKAFQFSDFGASTIAPAATQINQMEPNIPQGTPLQRAFQNFKLTVGSVANTAAQFQDPDSKQYKMPVELMAASNIAINDANDRLDKAIKEQARLAAKGDKDLEVMYDASYRGNPIPKDVIESATNERLEKNKPLTDIFPPETANKLKSIYTQTYQNLLSQAMMNPLANTPESKKLMRDQAQQEAIKQGIGSQINDRTIDLLQNQTSMPDNPLNGVYDPAGFTREVAAADAQGRQEFMTQYNLTPEEMARISQGQSVPEKGVGPEQIAGLVTVQNQALFIKLDSQQLGLAKKYVDWWTKQGRNYIDRIQAARQQDLDKSGIQGKNYETYAGQMESDQSNGYIGSLRDAYDNGYDRTKNQAYHNLISFDQKPEFRQAALLQMNPDLSDSEKKQFMTGFLLPIIQAAKEKNLNYDQTNTLIEQAIGSGETQDPTIAKIMPKVQKTRDNNQVQLDSILGKPFWRSLYGRGAQANAGIKLQRMTTGAYGVGDQSAGYAWFEDIYKNQQPDTGMSPQPAKPFDAGSFINELMQGNVGGFRDAVSSFDKAMGKETMGQPAR